MSVLWLPALERSICRCSLLLKVACDGWCNYSFIPLLAVLPEPSAVTRNGVKAMHCNVWLSGFRKAEPVKGHNFGEASTGCLQSSCILKHVRITFCWQRCLQRVPLSVLLLSWSTAQFTLTALNLSQRILRFSVQLLVKAICAMETLFSLLYIPLGVTLARV